MRNEQCSSLDVVVWDVVPVCFLCGFKPLFCVWLQAYYTCKALHLHQQNELLTSKSSPVLNVIDVCQIQELRATHTCHL